MASGTADFFTPTHRILLKYLTITTLLLSGVMIWLDSELRTRGAPLGSISLQLAGATQAAKRIVMHEWSVKHQIEATFVLGLDFLYIANYATWLFLGCLWSADRWQWQNETRSKWIRHAAWLAVAAAVLDVIENMVLFDFIHSTGRSPAYPIAFWCAVLKFICIVITLAGFISGLLVRTDTPADKTPSPEKKPEPTKKA